MDTAPRHLHPNLHGSIKFRSAGRRTDVRWSAVSTGGHWLVATKGPGSNQACTIVTSVLITRHHLLRHSPERKVRCRVNPPPMATRAHIWIEGSLTATWWNWPWREAAERKSAAAQPADLLGGLSVRAIGGQSPSPPVLRAEHSRTGDGRERLWAVTDRNQESRKLASIRLRRCGLANLTRGGQGSRWRNAEHQLARQLQGGSPAVTPTRGSESPPTLYAYPRFTARLRNRPSLAVAWKAGGAQLQSTICTNKRRK